MEVKRSKTKAPLGTPSEDTLKLEKYIAGKNNDEYVTYRELKEVLGIDIRASNGRGKFYSACKRLNRECVNKPNYGYKLSSPSTALPIVYNKVGRVKGAIKRTITATSNIKHHHNSEMTEPQRQAIDMTELGGKAILGKIELSQKRIRTVQPRLSEVNPVV
jgi:hypothetical protein